VKRKKRRGIRLLIFHRWNLTSAPLNFHSCHGIPANNSEFKDSHFAVYSQNQVRKGKIDRVKEEFWLISFLG
jgi:hypothetical protein